MEIKIKELITDKISGEWGEKIIDGKGVNIIRTANFTNLGNIDLTNIVQRKIDQKKIDQKKLVQGDVIIEKSGGSPTQPVGRVVYFDLDPDEIYLCNNFTSVLRANKSKIFPKYFFYQLFIGHIRGKTLKYQNKTTGIINLKLDNYLNEKIVVPSMQDQIRIAEVLTKTETLIKQRKDSIDLLDEFLRSTFLDMFGDPVKNEKKWEIVKLSQLGNLDRGISKNRPRNAPELLGGIYPLIQTGEVSNSGLYIKKYKKTYSELGLKQSKLWNEDTMLITIAANIAQTSILTFKACFPDSIVGFNSNKKESNVIYVHFLFSFFQKILEYNAPSSAQKNINLGILRELKVPKPSYKLQNKFASIVEKAEKVKEKYETSLKELENLFGSLSQKAFRGELDLSKLDVNAQIKEIENKIEAESVLDVSLETKITRSMQQFIKQTNNIQKRLALVSNTIPQSILNQIETINKIASPFQNLKAYQIPESLSQAMKSFDGIISITSRINQEAKEQFKTKLTWEEVNFEMVANWIKEQYSDYHFNSEILMNFLENERLTFSNYYASEELKTNPRLNESDDLKSFVFSALKGENQFINLEQFFYDAINENIQLNLRIEDYEIIKDKEKELRSGVYFKVVQ